MQRRTLPTRKTNSTISQRQNEYSQVLSNLYSRLGGSSLSHAISGEIASFLPPPERVSYTNAARTLEQEGFVGGEAAFNREKAMLRRQYDTPDSLMDFYEKYPESDAARELLDEWVARVGLDKAWLDMMDHDFPEILDFIPDTDEWIVKTWKAALDQKRGKIAVLMMVDLGTNSPLLSPPLGPRA